MKLQMKINPETQVIEEAKFKTFGCGSAIASSSLATEWVKGKTVEEALAIKNTDIVRELSLPPVKIHCSVLAEDAIKAAIGDWKKKHGIEFRWRKKSRTKFVAAGFCPMPSASFGQRAQNRAHACSIGKVFMATELSAPPIRENPLTERAAHKIRELLEKDGVSPE